VDAASSGPHRRLGAAVLPEPTAEDSMVKKEVAVKIAPAREKEENVESCSLRVGP
jgi:hypothetical protein